MEHLMFNTPFPAVSRSDLILSVANLVPLSVTSQLLWPNKLWGPKAENRVSVISQMLWLLGHNEL